MSTPDLKVVQGGNDGSDVEEVTPESHVIVEVRNFTDGEGRTVSGQYPVNDPEHPSFIGSFMVGTNVGPVRLPIEFPEGFTLEDCFDQFDKFAEETMQKAQEEANDRNRIVTPGDMKQNGPGIVVP